MSKTYAVTGVSGGIGATLARLLMSQGHKVIGFDLKTPTVDVDVFNTLDLNNPASIRSAARAVDQTIDGLCNTAGLPPKDGAEARILQVNFLGQRLFTAEVMPRVRQGGSIVNVASRAGAKWMENLDQNQRLAELSGHEMLEEFVATEEIDPTRAYNLSKEAMILWTFAMTEDLIAKGIRMNAVSPGAVETPILPDFARAFGERMTRNVARAGRTGRSEEVASVIAFLLGDESGWVKGIDIPVDGGMGGFNLADALDLDRMKEPG